MDSIQIVRDVYYNTSSPACFAGSDAVYREARKRSKKVTRKMVDDFLAQQEAYTLHKQARHRFPRNATRTAGIDVDWQADLADMRHLKQWNSHYQYILVCIDVLSRYAFAVPIKRKTPELVAEAMRSIVKHRKPWILTTDRGREFSGKPFQEFLQSEFIIHKYATSPDVKCAIVERYIRTLKTRIWRFFTKYNTKRYIDVLPDIVSAINHSYHRTIGVSPASVTVKNQNIVWKKLYGEKRHKKPKFKPGDSVRISIEKHALSKGYKASFSKEIFTVDKILRRQPPTFKLKDADGEVIDGVFYNEELVRVLKNEAIRAIHSVKKSERRDGELWHFVKFVDGQEKWIRNEELVSI